MAGLSEDDWGDLLDEIAGGRMIPVIGERAVSVGDSPELLYPVLARELAERLEVSRERAGTPLTVGAVSRAYLLQKADRNPIYTRLHRLLEPRRDPGRVLRNLASISAFRLYLSTTIDSLLEYAIRRERPNERPRVVAYYPKAEEKDIPCPLERLPAPTVYHLLGKAARARGQFVAWEDDLLDFLLALAHDFNTEATRHLAAALGSHSLLTIGLDLSDWILLLLLRIARQRSLSEESDQKTWITEPSTDAHRGGAPNLVFLVGGVRGGVRRIENPVEEFVEELARRWHTRPPGSSNWRSGNTGRRGITNSALMNARTVFLSYAREDEVAAGKLKQALESEGCSVFYDREGLRAGMDFERELESQVRHAAVFVAVISRTTETATGRHFFRLERNWAAEQAKWLSDAERAQFYIPVLVDDRPPPRVEQEPDIFRNSQWTHCPGGSTANVPGFSRRVAELQRKFGAAAP